MTDKSQGDYMCAAIRPPSVAVILWLAAVVVGAQAIAQQPPDRSLPMAAAPGGVCKPVSQRTSEVGCWILAHETVGQLTSSNVFWHLDTYPSRAAAEAAKGPRGTVVESLGKVWLLSIEQASWRVATGERVAEIGPLPVTAGTNYSVRYMEAIFTPGMIAPAHTHSGPEAWYTMAGETCLETPLGAQVGRAGGQLVIVPAGQPMHLTATGKEQRRSLVLILHDSSQPPTTMTHAWAPKGLCNNLVCCVKELIRSSIDGQCHGRLRLDESAQLRCNDCWRSCLFADFGSMDEHLIRWAGFGSAPWLRALCIPARQARRPSS